MDNKKDIGILFRERIDQLDKFPNENGWQAIQSELDKKQKRRAVAFWFWSIAIVVMGSICSIAVYNHFNNTKVQYTVNKNSTSTNIEATRYVTKYIQPKNQSAASAKNLDSIRGAIVQANNTKLESIINNEKELLKLSDGKRLVSTNHIISNESNGVDRKSVV